MTRRAGIPRPRLRALHRKLLRDLWRLRGQIASIAALVMCAVASVVSMYGTLASVRAERDRYYEVYRFADVFGAGTRVPAPVAARIARIPGVAAVAPRASLTVTVDVPGLDIPASARLIGIPDRGAPVLHRIHLVSGRLPRPFEDGGAVVSAGFAAANGVAAGDELAAVLDGRWRRLEIVGIGMSPEFLWEAAAAGFFTTDDRAFGLLWMSQAAVEGAAGLRGAFNEVAVALRADGDVPRVRAALDTILAPYGGVGAVGRDRQPSNYIIEQEFRQLRIFGVTLPAIFVIVAAFLLNVVLARLIAAQRPEVAALKAFGYHDGEVGLHYLGFAMAAVTLGAVAGLAAGVALGHGYTAMYARYFRFPDLVFRLEPGTAAVAAVACAAAACAGAWLAVGAAVRLPPAEALRPEAPDRYRPLLLERIGLADRVGPSARMVLRTIERRPARSLSGIVGTAMAMGLVAGTLALFDAAFRMADVVFRHAQREDVAVGFQRPRRRTPALAELRTLPGVMLVEGYRSAPIRVRRGTVTRTTAVMALDSVALLRRLVDDEGTVHALPSRGAVLSGGLARALRLRPGDTLHVELLEAGSAPRPLVVAGVLDELVGMNVYVRREVLDRLLDAPPAVSGAFLRIDPGREREVLRALKGVPAVATASSRQALIDAWERQMLENIRISGTLIVAFAVIIAIGVVYNGARIALSERGRDLATLRVLGFTRREVAALLFGEQGTLLVVALPIGSGLGMALTWLLSRAFQAEDHHFPIVTALRTYVGAAGVVIAAGAMAGLLLQRRLTRMDLIAVLKTRE